MGQQSSRAYKELAGRELMAGIGARKASIHGEEERLMSRAIQDVEVPLALREQIAYNQQFAPVVYKTIISVLARSMQDPRTKPRIIWTQSDESIKERLGVIYDLMTRMCGDGNRTLKGMCDRLWDMLLRRLTADDHPDDIVGAEVGKVAWGKSEGEGVGSVKMDWNAKDIREE